MPPNLRATSSDMKQIALPALLLLVPLASAQNLVQDPGFESAPVGLYTTPGVTIDGGDWIVAEGPNGGLPILAVNSGFVTVSGERSVYLQNASSEQALALEVGRLYRIELDAYGHSKPETVLVDFGAQRFSGSVAWVNNYGAKILTHLSFLATATEADTLLRLGSSGNVEIDNVSVTPVPEPASLAALSLGTLALLRRKRA